MKDSLKWLLDKFPYFLDKDAGSNFHKSTSVLNENFRDLHNDIFKTHLGNRLQKRVLIWKEQEDEHEYTIQFYVNLSLLKTVTCYKNDEVIYTESYSYEDKVNTFIYSYEGTSLKLIPDDKFHISVETWDEYLLEKGFPENDTIQDNMYDHDSSLDEFGLLYDMPRKNYIYKENTNLADTEPPYNNRLTEDDYHYMNRLLFYIQNMNDTPLPVLEVWKLFGIPLDEISLINREQYLCKMYSQKLHGGDDWEPEPWEHKDSMGCYSIEDLFFFVELDNPTPVVGQIINFTFTFMDMFGEEKTTDFLINVYLDDVLIKSGVDPSHDYSFDTTDVEASTLVFRFEAESESIIQTLVSDDFIVTLKDCNTADWYVSLEGSDVTGDGSQLNPFKTLPKALSCVEGSRNVIVLCEGEFTITNEQVISTSTSIISCNEAIIRNDTSIDFFRILQGCNLYLKNVALKYKCCTMQDNFGFINKNITQNPIYIRMNTGLIVDGVNLLCRPQLTFDLDEISDNMYAHSNITVTGTLLTADDTPEPVEGETVELMGSGEVLDTSITDEDGEFELEYLINTLGDHTFNCKIEDSQEYCESVSEDFTVTASAMSTSLSATMSSTLLWGDDLNLAYVLEDYYDNPVTVGTIKLKEGNTVVASVTAGETLTYTPPLGDHTYKLVWEAPDNTWIGCETETFEVEVTADELKTVFTGSSVSLPNLGIGGTGDAVLIDWGDGTTELYTGGGTSHTYQGALPQHDVIFTRRTITSLGQSCFEGCTNLKTIGILNSITTIGSSCFNGCTGLTSIIIPSSTTSIGGSCFSGCTNLAVVNFPSTDISLGVYSFRYCTSLTSVTIKPNMSLGQYVFQGSGLTTVVVENGVTSLSQGIFDDCNSLTSVTLPNTLTSLPGQCFDSCRALTTIDIPASITSIGGQCFRNCQSLAEVILHWTSANDIVTYNSNVYSPYYSNKLFYVPDNTRALYEAKDYPTAQIRSDFEIQISATKQIITSSESTTITAKLDDPAGYNISGKTLSYEVKHGATVLDSGSATTDSNGEISFGYTGAAVGQVDVIVSYGTLLQETYEILDAIAYDKGTITEHSDIWTGNTEDLSRQSDGSLFSSTATRKLLTTALISGDFEATFEAIGTGSPLWGVQDESSNMTRFYMVNDAVNYYKITRVDSIITAKYSPNGTTWTNLTPQSSNVTSADCYFLFHNNSGTKSIKFKNLKIYPI